MEPKIRGFHAFGFTSGFLFVSLLCATAVVWLNVRLTAVSTELKAAAVQNVDLENRIKYLEIRMHSLLKANALLEQRIDEMSEGELTCKVSAWIPISIASSLHANGQDTKFFAFLLCDQLKQ